MTRLARSSRRTRLACRAALLLTMGIATGSASAAVTAPHVIAVLANSSALELSGYTPGAMLIAEVVRNDVVVGSATGLVADGTPDPKLDSPGTFNVNPTKCWTRFTPVILPGDIVRVTSPDPGQTWTDQTRVRGVSVDSVEVVAGVLLVHGTAADTAGAPLPVIEIENRIISTTGFFTNGRKRIQTIHAGAGEGTIAFDAGVGNTHWTATYAELEQSDLILAQASTTQIRGLWATAAADEVTIMIKDAVAGPAAPCIEPLADNAVTKATPPMINVANVGKDDVVLTGVSLDATQVDVTLDDDDPATPALLQTVNPTPLPGSQSWTVTFPKADVAGLTDGLLKAMGTYFIGGNPGGIPGADLLIPKDTIAPTAPTASPGPGTYSETQAVQLQHSDGTGSRVVYTTDGSDPTALSGVAIGQVFVTSSLTLKARVIDAVGNVGAIASFGYTIDRSVRREAASQSSGGNLPRAVAPVISQLRTKCVPIGAPKAKVRAKCRAGVSFSLSVAARVTFVVRNAKGKIIGSFVRSGLPGANTVVLPAKLGGRAVKPGRYTFALTASAGGVTSTTKTSPTVALAKP